MANQFLIKETMTAMQGLSAAEITALQDGTYEGVQLLGYYEKGDTPAPIIYYLAPLTPDPGPDDGGSIIALSGIKLIHKFPEKVDVGYFGAYKAGDVTQIIQKVVDRYKSVIISKDCLINPVDVNYPTSKFNGGIKLRTNSTLTFINQATLKMVPTAAIAYTFINCVNVSNVSIYAPKIIGDVGEHLNIEGEDGYGIYIVDSENINVYEGYVSKCWGDGYYIGSDSKGTKGGGLFNCIADDNRRQGLSIVSWEEGLVDGGAYVNTGRTSFTAPGYGIDIEPNAKGTDKINVTLANVTTKNNEKGGLQLVPGFFTDVKYINPSYNVKVTNYTSVDDGTSGAIRFANPPLATMGMRPSEKIYGAIFIQGVTILNSKERSIDFARWFEGSPKVTLRDIYIENCNQDHIVSTNESQCAVVAYIDPAQSLQLGHGEVSIENITIVDNRTTKWMLVPIWLYCGTTQSIDNFYIKNINTYGQKSVSNGEIVISKTNGFKNEYAVKKYKSFSSDLDIISGSFNGIVLSSNVNNVFTLPLANNSVGLEYEFENPNAVVSQIRVKAGDRLGNNVNNTATSLVLRTNSDRIRVRSVGRNKWEIVEQFGTITTNGFVSGFKNKDLIRYSVTIPSISAEQGDEVYNSTNTIGQPLGWKYIGSNWIPFGIIGMLQAIPSANSATLPSATYIQSEVESILTELRDLKSKLRTAGVLAT
ncbi:hypothetical protein OHD16_10415 [Sphingobacterium sp. ML3W]|uniref:hypothetical protein n=1 Tax=Sphingobacterium sp. ML3W TaxID=1538644 RepID=UPI00249B1D7A|nr:hypothetical protein [Sphingobacterium sp. ML3W]WFA80373.1 hypothetical protein OGI71_03560 [Sphingobacterium sp. ML3W]